MRMHYLAQYTKEVSWLHAREMDIVHLSRYKKKTKNQKKKTTEAIKARYILKWLTWRIGVFYSWKIKNDSLWANSSIIISGHAKFLWFIFPYC